MDESIFDIFKGWNGIIFLISVLASALILERIIPWRREDKVDVWRWARNASMTFYGTIFLSLAPFLGTYLGAVVAGEQGIGLFNAISVGLWVQILVSVFVLDSLTYIEHRFLHKYYILWRAHRAHHGDTQIDATTSLRFHPFETLLRSAFGIPFIFMLGVPPEAVLVYFAVNVLMNTWSHANITLPGSVDRVISKVIITPNMHRLHHSALPEHLDKNFGTIFAMWDQLFGTYCGPGELADDEPFGLDGPEEISPDSFANIALDPFRTPEAAAIPKATNSGKIIRL
ncbi:MAG: sterol desaturase [Hyphococcus sp.]|nr:MAG: sterol desaturase [Marinicaulis sp.]